MIKDDHEAISELWQYAEQKSVSVEACYNPKWKKGFELSVRIYFERRVFLEHGDDLKTVVKKVIEKFERYLKTGATE